MLTYSDPKIGLNKTKYRETCKALKNLYVSDGLLDFIHFRQSTVQILPRKIKCFVWTDNMIMVFFEFFLIF